MVANQRRGSQAQETRLGGAVTRVVFHAPETGFSVLRVAAGDERAPVTIVGSVPGIVDGARIECIGRWTQDAQYGRQFRARELRIVPPNTLAGIEKYLASGLIEGIGAHFAKRLVGEFGEQVFEVIDREPERLATIPGIGRKRVAAVVRAWQTQKAVREIMAFLHSHGLGSGRAVRIYRRYGKEAILRINENPYRLTTELQGFGFKTADTLAHQLGIPADSPLRIGAGIRHVLYEQTQHGHCACSQQQLMTLSGTLLGVDETSLRSAIEAERRAGTIVVDNVRNEPCFYVQALYEAEAGVAGHLHRLCSQAAPRWMARARQGFQKAAGSSAVALSPGQHQAITTALQSKVTIITGGPGVGKTTVLKHLLQCVQGTHVRIALCAPTGRAAKRLSEATGLAARTLHRLLEFDPQRYDFRYNERNLLPVDFVVLDEASMVDIVLMYRLLRALPDRTCLTIVGDADQLPAVGPGAVLADALESGCVPVVRLNKIFRQAAASYITINAHRIQQGKMPDARPGNQDQESDFFLVRASANDEISNKVVELVTDRIPQRFGLHPVRDIQVLTPMNRGTLGTESLNIVLQSHLNPQAQKGSHMAGTGLTPGDKVIQTRNDYEKEVFNGDLGRVVSIDQTARSVIIDYEGRQVRYSMNELDAVKLAYATTIHKAQGSEYPAVVIPLSTQHFPLLQRDLLYTAVTRGKQLVVIVGQPRALAIAVHKEARHVRVTALGERLVRECRAGIPAR